MKTYSFCAAVALVGVFAFASLAGDARADTDSASGMSSGLGSGSGRTRRGGGKPNSLGSASADLGRIHGSCSIAESPMNPIPGPCVNLVLVLNDAQGNEVVKTRTTPQGQFDFIAEQGKAYKIASGSKFYEVAAPKEMVHGGDNRVNLQLQQK